jgi:VHL beta domain
MYNTGDNNKKGGLLSDHAVAFWTVISGLVAIITLMVTLTTLRSGPGGGGGGPTPGPSPSSPSPSPTPSPSSSAIFFQYSGVTPYPCSDYQTIHSVAGGSGASLVFVNQSSQTVQIDWITFGGARDTYDTLQPGGSYSVNTDTEEVWLITDYQAACLDYFYVNNAGDIVVK